MNVPVRDCRKTNRVKRILHDGTFEYEVECRTVRWVKEYVGDKPVVAPKLRM